MSKQENDTDDLTSCKKQLPKFQHKTVNQICSDNKNKGVSKKLKRQSKE